VSSATKRVDEDDVGKQFAKAIKKHLIRYDPAADADDFATADFLSCNEFLSKAYRFDWLVKALLVKGQPAVLGGPLKSMKTSVLLDLAISLASGTPALGRFQVPSKLRVGLISGESGGERLQKMFRAICKSKGIDRSEKVDIRWMLTLPRLALPEHLESLNEKIRQNKLDVIAIDPLYLCLLAGALEIQASNMFQMGPLLKAVVDACLAEGCTPILAHHTNREGARSYQPPELHELAYSGIDLFARQWWLLRRRQPYDQPGQHQLWLKAGGSSGFASCWAVDIDEGTLGERDERKWEVTARSEAEERSAVQEQKLTSRREKAATTYEADRRRVIESLRESPAGETLTALSEITGIGRKKLSELLERLVVEGTVKKCRIKRPSGGGGSKECRGYILAAGKNGDLDDDENASD
jgi:hypothetical protein